MTMAKMTPMTTTTMMIDNNNNEWLLAFTVQVIEWSSRIVTLD
jgi:hypothetical protein